MASPKPTCPSSSEGLPGRIAKGLDLVEALSWKLNGPIDRDDLVGAGGVAVTQALQSYDPGRGMSWSSWAYMNIRREMIDEIRRFEFWRRYDEPLLPQHDPQSERSDMEILASRELVEQILRPLRPRERYIVWERAQGRSQAEIGEVLGISASRVCQIEREAIRKMKDAPPA